MPACLSDVARTWVGTRFAHQGRCKQTAGDAGGVDCLGLLVGVAQECGLTFEGKAALQVDETDYGHYPNEERLLLALQRFLKEKDTDNLQKDDIVLLDVDGRRQHLGIVAEQAKRLTLIHAYAPAKKVVEHGFDSGWKRRVRAAFRLS